MAEKNDEFKVSGEDVQKKVKDLLHEGNVRKITIKDKSGNIVLAIPLTIGVIGAVIAPVLAAVGAVAALLTECTITVERKENKGPSTSSGRGKKKK